jgi:hypothetical protein
MLYKIFLAEKHWRNIQLSSFTDFPDLTDFS